MELVSYEIGIDPIDHKTVCKHANSLAWNSLILELRNILHPKEMSFLMNITYYILAMDKPGNFSCYKEYRKKE